MVCFYLFSVFMFIVLVNETWLTLIAFVVVKEMVSHFLFNN